MPPSDQPDFLGQVRAAILAQQIVPAGRPGAHTVAALNLPEEFVGRVANASLRAAFEQDFRSVVLDGSGGATPADPAKGSDDPAAVGISKVRVHRVEPPRLGKRAAESRGSWREARPPLRGFRAPILNAPEEEWTFDTPGQGSPREELAAADLVASRLAFDGLIPTLVAAIEALGAAGLRRTDAEGMKRLRRVGLPTDLIAFFDDGTSAGAEAVVGRVAERLSAGASAEQVKRELAGLSFRFLQTIPGFRVVTDSGEHEAGLVRMQMTRGDYWGGIGAGGNLDVLREMVAALPAARFVVSIQERHLHDFLRNTAGWPGAERIEAIPTHCVVAQWAHDNAKPGLAGGDGSSRAVWLAPRFASRGEDGSTFVPGENLLLEGLAGASMKVVQSPLVFQGGNVAAVGDLEVKTGGREGITLLVGEAEVYRNTALGLSRGQVLEAIAVEFGADRCIVLAGVSFHIDYELSVRTLGTGGRPIAFVNDSETANRIILECGLDALSRAGLLGAPAGRKARQALGTGRFQELVSVVGAEVLAPASIGGGFPERFARVFSAGPSDSGPGNLHRFLLALDSAASRCPPAWLAGFDPNTRAYLAALRRRDADRSALHAQIASLGWLVVGIPSTAEAGRSTNYLNGIDLRGRYLMPAYGGLFDRLDAAAKDGFARSLPPTVQVIGVHCGESQRRVGALRCSTGVMPSP